MFTLVVGVCVLIAWGGALWLRPQEDRIEHFTVLDAVAATADHQQVTTVRIRSWLALLVARHGRAQVVMGAVTASGANSARPNTLACFGTEVRTDAGGFVGTQRYRAAAAAPGRLALPMRSTAKALKLDYVADYDRWQAQLAKPWVMPNGRIDLIPARGRTVRPVGILRHGLPNTLVDVRIVFCPCSDRRAAGSQADGAPVTARLPARSYGPASAWPPDDPLDLGKLTRWTRLVIPPFNKVDRTAPYDNRDLADEGHLGVLMNLGTGRLGAMRGIGPGRGGVRQRELTPAAEMLSFYSVLPSPDFRWKAEMMAPSQSPATYQRALGRGLDLSHLLTMRCLIIIGHLADGPNPTPLTVDGRELPASGWTMVRWICPLPDLSGGDEQLDQPVGDQRSLNSLPGTL